MTATPGAPAGHDGFVHEALIYDSDEQLLDVTVPFLRDGAAAGEPTVIAVCDRAQRVVLDELAGVGSITVLGQEPYGDPLAALRQNPALFARLTGGGARRVRVLGEVPHDAWRGWLRYEAAVNVFCATLPVWAMCAYDAHATPDEVLTDIQRTHPYLAAAGAHAVPSPRYEQPGAFLAEHACAAVDPLEALAPDLVLAEPTPAGAGNAVCILGAATRLDRDSLDALRLSVAEVVTNAVVHGRPPVLLHAWAATDRVIVKVTDSGGGPPDPYVGLVPRDPDVPPEDANALHVVHQALTDVSMFTTRHGFTVRLVERTRD